MANRADLEKQIEELGRKFPHRNEKDLFALWVMYAYATNSRDVANGSLTGASGEKAIDAIYIDHATEVVVVCQAKYRDGIGHHDEKRALLLEFAKVAEKLFAEDDAEFNAFAKTLEPIAKEKAAEARSTIFDRGYRATFLYATTGRASDAAVQEADEEIGYSSSLADFQFLDGESLLRILEDFLDGVAPPIPSLDLRLADDNHIYDVDKARGIQSWIISMKGDEVADLFKKAQVRLFARNIRGYLGETKINEKIISTIESEPENFFYFNNGVTIVCDGADMRKVNYDDVIRVRNPQVINGQQTTRSLAASSVNTSQTKVIVKVIQIPRDSKGPSGTSTYDTVVGRIVEATNSQNAIKASDLKSNHRIQVDLEYDLRLRHYFYARKRMSKKESRRIHGNVYRFYLTKFDLAKAVGALISQPALPFRRGQEPLFDDFYDDIFKGRTLDQFLSMFWYWKMIEAAAYGDRTRTNTKWVVAHQTWEYIEQSIYGSRAYIDNAEIWQHDGRPSWPKLESMLDYVFDLANKFYEKESKSGGVTVEADTFWKNMGSYDGYFSFFDQDDRRAPKLTKLAKAAAKEMQETA